MRRLAFIAIAVVLPAVVSAQLTIVSLNASNSIAANSTGPTLAVASLMLEMLVRDAEARHERERITSR